MLVYQPGEYLAKHYLELPRFEPVNIDSSALSTFKTCPKKYFWRYVLGYAEKEMKIYLAFGSAYHKFRELLEVKWKENKNHGECILYALEEGALKSWGDTKDPEMGTDFDFLTKRRLVNSCMLAGKEWTKEKIAGQIEVLATEQSFVVEVHPGVNRSGRFDQVIKFVGSLWGRDFKTTKVEQRFYVRSFEPNDQFIGYTFAQTQLHGKRVRGQLVDVLWNSKSVKPTKEKSGDKGPELFSSFVEVTESQMNRWKEDQLYWHAALAGAREQDLYAFNEGHCKFCEYRKVCTQPDERTQLYQLKMNYRHEVWDNSKPED